MTHAGPSTPFLLAFRRSAARPRPRLPDSPGSAIGPRRGRREENGNSSGPSPGRQPASPSRSLSFPALVFYLSCRYGMGLGRPECGAGRSAVITRGGGGVRGGTQVGSPIERARENTASISRGRSRSRSRRGAGPRYDSSTRRAEACDPRDTDGGHPAADGPSLGAGLDHSDPWEPVPRPRPESLCGRHCLGS